MTTSTNNITVPTKTGYTFGGYYTGTGGSGTQLISATGYITSNFTTTKYSGNAEIYAKWTVNTYTVTLNDQSATTAGTTSVTATYAAAMPAITKPSRAYTVTYNYATAGVANDTATATYTFGGYYDATNGGGTQYYTAAGASARNWDKTSATTLYAQWTSASVTLPNPTREGYRFAGWYTLPSEGTKIGNAGESYTPTINTTLYARWVRQFTITLSVQTNRVDNNSAGGTVTGAGTYDAGTQVTIVATANPGYRFYDWETNFPGPTTNSNPSWTIAATANINIGAAFLQEYTVTYNANGGSGAPENQTKVHFLPLTLSSAVPTRSGYTFTGWNTASDGSGTPYASGATYTANAGTTLYAQWERNLKVGDYVEYVPNMASAVLLASTSGYTADQTYYPSSTTLWRIFSINDGIINIIPANGIGNITIRGSLGNNMSNLLNTVSENYVNSAYATSARSLGTPSVLSTITSGLPVYTMNTEDKTIIDENPTLNCSNNTFSGGYTPYGAACFAIEILDSSGTLQSIPAVSGHYVGNPYNGQQVPVIDEVFPIEGTIRPIVSLKADTQFTGGTGTQANPYRIGARRTITYNANGGSGAPATQSVVEYTSTILSNTYPTYANKTFMGWNTKADGTGTYYDPGSIIYLTNSDVVLYAQWTTLRIGEYITYIPSLPSANLQYSWTVRAGTATRTQTYYPSATTRWRVFGLDNCRIKLIPEGGAATITMYSKEGCTQAASILSEVSNNYINPSLAESARSLGSPPSKITAQENFAYPVDFDTMNTNDKYILDTYGLGYTGDITLLPIYRWNSNPHIQTYSGSCHWSCVHYHLQVLQANGELTTVINQFTSPELYRQCELQLVADPDGSMPVEITVNQITGTVRPIVTLKPNMKLTGGSGTSASPYTIGL